MFNLCFVFLQTAIGQTTITNAQFLDLADELVMMPADTNGYDVGPSGIDQTWNFNGLVSGGANFTYKMDAKGTSTHGDSFTNADFAYNTWNLSSLDFYKLKTGKLEWWGSDISPTVVVHTNPADLIEFDMEFGDSTYDNFTGGVTFGSFTGTRIGWVSSVADGTGTLKLPTGTFHDVVRVRHRQHFEDSIFVSSSSIVKIKYDFDNYWFFTDVRRGPLVEFVSFVKESSAGFAYDNRIHINQDAVPNGINEVPENLVALWPNPASDRLFIQPLESGLILERIEVIDLQGRLLRSLKADANGITSFSIASLTPGNYVVKLVHSEGTLVKNLAIQH